MTVHETFTYTDAASRLAAERYDDAIEDAWERARRPGTTPDLDGYYRAVLRLRALHGIGEVGNYSGAECEGVVQERKRTSETERMQQAGCVRLTSRAQVGDRVFYFRAPFIVKEVRPLKSYEKRNGQQTVMLSLGALGSNGEENGRIVKVRR